MKKFKLLLVFTSIALLFASCNKDEVPTGGFTWYDADEYALNVLDLSKATENPIEVTVGQKIMFKAEGNGQYFSVWPGEKGNNYYARNLADSLKGDTINLVATKKYGYSLIEEGGNFVYSYSYSNPGEYSVVFVTRSVYENGEVVKETIDSAKIIVKDYNTAITGTNKAKYKFQVKSPANCTVEFADSDVIITAPFGASLANVEIDLKADKAILAINNGTLTLNEKTGVYTWKGSLEANRKITVTSISGATQDYTVKSSILAASAENNLLSFDFDTYKGVITGNSVAIEIPGGIDITKAKPKFTASVNASVLIGATAQVSDTTEVDLTSPVTYTVKAQDGTNKTYTVTATIVPTTITAISFTNLNPVITGTIDQEAETIDFSTNKGTDVTKLIPTFTVSKFAKVFVGTKEIVSGVTDVNFTNEVEFSLKVGSTVLKTYKVNVTVLP